MSTFYITHGGAFFLSFLYHQSLYTSVHVVSQWRAQYSVKRQPHNLCIWPSQSWGCESRRANTHSPPRDINLHRSVSNSICWNALLPIRCYVFRKHFDGHCSLDRLVRSSWQTLMLLGLHFVKRKIELSGRNVQTIWNKIFYYNKDELLNAWIIMDDFNS